MNIDLDSPFGSIWIFGMPFFREFYTVFVQSNHQRGSMIYTAPASDECEPMNRAGSEMRKATQSQARLIDASKLRMPPWLQKAVDLRHLPTRSTYTQGPSPNL